MHNNIGGNNFLSSDGYELLRAKSNGRHHHNHHQERTSHHDNNGMVSKAASESLSSKASFYSAKAEFYTASINEDGGYKILAQALSIEYSSTTVESGNPYSANASVEFKPPSPLDVANKVLGFVENRLNSELEAGADSERISSLISQAREGVQKGFSQARADIESLGLMTEKLDKKIEKGFDRIESGLNKMEERFVGRQQLEDLEAGAAKAEVPSVGQLNDQPETFIQGVQVSGSQIFQETVTKSGDVEAAGPSYSRSSYMNSSEFSLKTQDGDTITIRYNDAGTEVFKSAGNKLFAGQVQAQGYQLEVNGELDEGELAAIEALFDQLGEVSSLFFGGSFQDAFASALEVGFDASEIASFSLDLSKVQSQEVRTYSNPGNAYEQSAGELGEIQKNQSLIDMVSLFEKSLELLKSFDDQQFDFRALVLESISREVVQKDVPTQVSQNIFSDFAERLLALLEK